MKCLSEEEVLSLMNSDAYKNKYNPKYEETQCLVRKGWENLAPDDDRNENPDNYYVWNAKSDSKTRSSHAERDGQVFCWDNPPDGGHPGEAFNCRCKAKPYEPPKNMCKVDDNIYVPTNIIGDNPISQFGGTIYDFGKNLINLKWNNKYKKSDKFHHCNANCEATQRGKTAENFAISLSNGKELFDQKWKRFPKYDSDEDQIANEYGRSQAKKHPHKKCINLCEDVDKFFKK